MVRILREIQRLFCAKVFGRITMEMAFINVLSMARNVFSMISSTDLLDNDNCNINLEAYTHRSICEDWIVHRKSTEIEEIAVNDHAIGKMFFVKLTEHLRIEKFLEYPASELWRKLEESTPLQFCEYGNLKYWNPDRKLINCRESKTWEDQLNEWNIWNHVMTIEWNWNIVEQCIEFVAYKIERNWQALVCSHISRVTTVKERLETFRNGTRIDVGNRRHCGVWKNRQNSSRKATAF